MTAEEVQGGRWTPWKSVIVDLWTFPLVLDVDYHHLESLEKRVSIE